MRKLGSVEAFLASNLLQRGDIVLCNRRGLAGWPIRWATSGDFTHAALVFVVPHRQEGFDNTFLIESARDGVDIVDICHYVRDLAHRYDVAVKRVEEEWFQAPDKGIPSLVRGHMLNHIAGDYDYRTLLKLAKAALRRMWSGLSGLTRRLRQAPAKKRKTAAPMPNYFICSGFVQYGFYRAIELLVRKNELPPDCLDDVTFINLENPSDDELLATTPQDLANSGKLAWKYFIRSGWVYEVGSWADIDRIIQSEKAGPAAPSAA